MADRLPAPAAGPPRSQPTSRGIPPSRVERDRLRRVVQDYLLSAKAVPPMPLDELRAHAAAVARAADAPEAYRDYLAVLLHNEMWRETLAAVPFDRRLLLLPKCLRAHGTCPAAFDAMGLRCRRCGSCPLTDLQEEADRLGYAVLVAEGSPVVTSIIRGGGIHAVIGVSCLSVLEESFPYLEAAAIPGIAIPLLRDGCRNTDVDLDWVWDVIHLTSDDRARRLDLDALREEVHSWFTPAALDALLGPAEDRTERIARDWLTRRGKRWRPFLAACASQAFQPDPAAPIPDDLRRVALAVECFHKASLVHDDIEDGDDRRYGEKTLHEEHGIPVALNVGDFLIGEGYRLIAECRVHPERKAEMLRAATDGHRRLCRGQGAELCWARRPEPLAPAQVLDIFRNKTSPAFEVALRLGSLCADGGDGARDVLGPYSEALGVAYQIRDDLEDFAGGAEPGDGRALRPSLLLALLHARASGARRRRTEALWRRRRSRRSAADPATLAAWAVETGADAEARRLLDANKLQAIRALRPLANATLKGLLRRIVGKIFNDVQLKSWCRDIEARQDGSRAEGAGSVA